MKFFTKGLLIFLCAFTLVNAQEYFWVLKQSGGGRGNPVDYDRNNHDIIYYGSTNSVYKSTDRGETFTTLGSVVPNANGIKRVLTYDNDPSTLLIAYFGSSGGDKVAKTTDNGFTWTVTASGLDFSYFGIPMTKDNTDPDIVYTMDGNNFMKSTDFGSTWDIISNPPTSGAPCDIEKFANSDVILIGDNGTGIVRSTDGGITWNQVFSTSGEIPMISTDKMQPGVAWATKWGGGGGLLKSTNYGETWTHIPYFSGMYTWGVNVTPNFSPVVVTGQWSGDNFITHDGGDNWISTSIPSNNYAIVIIDTMTIFAAQGNGIYKLDSPYFIPVELTSFNANVSDNEIILNWSTATETNNKGFEIERSFDKKTYEKIGFVPGFGTVTEKKTYTYEVKDDINKNSYFRLKQVDFDGTYEYSDVVEVEGLLPSEYQLSQNFPNPFNPSTKIKFALPVDSKVKVSIFNMIGEKVSELTNSSFTAGKHDLNFDASRLSSGNYFYVLEATGVDGSNFVDTKKMTLIK